MRPVPLTLTVEAEKEEVTEGEPVVYRIVMSNRTAGVEVGVVYRYKGKFLSTEPSSTVTGIRSRRGVLYWEVERETVDDAVDQPAFEAGMGLEITPQLALDGSGLVFAGAVSLTYPRPPAPVLDALEKGLSGCDGREDQGNSSRNCPLDVFERPGPLDLSERGVDSDELGRGEPPGRQAGTWLGCPSRPRR